jgi:LmbE family N-acetylglucosaminyl deacetylase
LLFLLAHPDDETFIAGGTIAKYAAAGVEIGVVCATRGERGKTGDICSRDDLARVREAEVRDAAQILGIRHLEILSYEDQMLASAQPDEIRRAMIAAVRRQRPQIAVTFDPNGMNLHPDHIAISRFASDAVAAAADPRWCPETGEPHMVERMLWCGRGACSISAQWRTLPVEPEWTSSSISALIAIKRTRLFERIARSILA